MASLPEPVQKACVTCAYQRYARGLLHPKSKHLICSNVTGRFELAYTSVYLIARYCKAIGYEKLPLNEAIMMLFF